jgi:hypothetical protein
MNNKSGLRLLTADDILHKEWPEPVWAIPDILPVGLGILAGPPKIGKSWMGLQIAKEVTTGGNVFGREVDKGAILYLALEDPPRRLKERMKLQKWTGTSGAHFLPLGGFMEQIGDLRNGGSGRLAEQIDLVGYRLVVVDTFSRAIHGKQKEVEDMTAWLTPLQEMAHNKNCAILLIDHHKKGTSFEPDVIADILGSTAKGAMADTVLGLYRERNKSEAELRVTGREVEEHTLSIRIDWLHGCWRMDSSKMEATPNQADVLDVLEEISPAKVTDIAEAIDRNKGAVYKDLTELEKNGKVQKGEDKLWRIVP